jgi:predicted ArsR family transcriptional regulator
MPVMPNARADIQAVALLDEPVRRALYEWVAEVGRPVGREEAAAAVHVSRALAAFHLDRLVGVGLLVAEYRRLSGRAGPGAGRPAKLYRRGPRGVVVSLPDRHYDIPARLFAEAIEQLTEPGPPDALGAAAHRMGKRLGSAARKSAGRRPSQRRLRAALLETMAERGYEPRETSDGIRLGNCPFSELVDDHRQLVCGMNLALADGLIDGLGHPTIAARLDPQPGQCCVAIGRATRA